MRMRGKIGAAALSALCVAGVAACSGAGDQAGPTRQAELGPAQRLSAAKAKVDDAASVHLKLTSANVPKGARGLVSADGWGKHPPAFKGTFKVALQGVQADAEITAIGSDVWAKLPLVPGTSKINPADFGFPNPADLFAPATGITTLLPATTDPKAGEKKRQGSEIVTPISGTIPGQKVVDLLKFGDATGTYQATYALTDSQELRSVELVGPFFGAGASTTYTLTLDQYGVPTTIEKP